LGESHEDLSHAEVSHLWGAVEYNNRESESSSKILGGLGLTGTSWAGGGATHAQVKCLGKSDVTSIGKRCNDKSSAIAYIFIVVVSSPIANSSNSSLPVILWTLLFKVEFEL
jgi:hypothetical protein